MNDKEKLAEAIKTRNPGDGRLSFRDAYIKRTLRDTVRLHIPLTDPDCVHQMVGELRAMLTEIEQTMFLNTISDWQKMNEIYWIVRGADDELGGMPLSKRLGKYSKNSDTTEPSGAPIRIVSP